MAERVQIGGEHDLYVGEDKDIELEILDGSPDDLASIPIDVTGRTIWFDVRKPLTSATPIISRQMSIQGVFDADRSLNTQRAVISLTDTETEVLKAYADVEAGYFYSVKDLEPGAETIIAEGPFVLERATQVA